MEREEYASHDAVGLAELLRRRQVSASEVVEAALSRTSDVNGRINAAVHLFADPARSSGRQPDGPFKSVPFLLKDLAGSLKGAPLTKGSKALRGNVASHDSEMVTRYRRAGVVFIGSTNAPELGLLETDAASNSPYLCPGATPD